VRRCGVTLSLRAKQRPLTISGLLRRHSPSTTGVFRHPTAPREDGAHDLECCDVVFIICLIHLENRAPPRRCAQFQAKSKMRQIGQNPAKPGQRKSKEKSWIPLDSLGRNAPFQGLAPTPQGVFSFSAGGPFGSPDSGPAAVSGAGFASSNLTTARPRLAATRLSFSTSLWRAASS
jgi:hypothetical protein